MARTGHVDRGPIVQAVAASMGIILPRIGSAEPFFAALSSGSIR